MQVLALRAELVRKNAIMWDMLPVKTSDGIPSIGSLCNVEGVQSVRSIAGLFHKLDAKLLPLLPHLLHLFHGNCEEQSMHTQRWAQKPIPCRFSC